MVLHYEGIKVCTSFYFGLVCAYHVHKNNIQSEKKEKYQKQQILVVFLLCFYWVIEGKL